MEVSTRVHFAEVDLCLQFDRDRAWGYHLLLPDIQRSFVFPRKSLVTVKLEALPVRTHPLLHTAALAWHVTHDPHRPQASAFSSRMMEEPVSIHWRAPKEGWKRALRESEGGTAQPEGAGQRKPSDAADAGLGHEHKHEHDHDHDHDHDHTHAQPRATARRKWMPKPPATGGVALGRSDSHPLTLNNHVIRRPVQGARAGVHPEATDKGGRAAAADTARKPQRRAWGKQALWDDTTNVVDGTLCAPHVVAQGSH